MHNQDRETAAADENQRAQSAIRESDARKAAILESALDCIIAMDDQGRIVDFNPAAERTFGYKREQVVGRTVAETIIPPHLREAHWRGLARFMQIGEGPVLGRRIEMPALRADGSEFPCELAINVTRLEGKPPFFTAYLRDISERLRGEETLRESETRFRTMVNDSPLGVFLTDSKGDCLYINTLYQQITGLTLEQARGSEWIKALHPDDRDRVSQTWRDAIASNRHFDSIHRFQHPDRAEVWTSVKASPMRSGETLLGYVGTVDDITERKRAEAELVRHRTHLEDLVNDRTRELEDSHQKLRLSERMAALGTLSAGLGHDLGNLLLPLRLRLDSMQTKGVPPETREDLDAIRTCAEYLQRLANGLRLFALDPDASDSSADRTNLSDWWPDVFSFFKNTLPRQVALKNRFAENLPAVRLARPNLTQAIFNLVQNAGDAMRDFEHGEVVVWAEPGPDARTLRVGVTDSGPGMAPDVRQRCLEPFFTTKSRSISTGLGLALVHGIVQKVAGTIHIDSELGRGTTFTLTLPASIEADSAIEGKLHRPLAIVSLQDDRMRAYVDSVLQSMSFEVVFEQQPTMNDAMLWLTDPRESVLETAQQFVQAGAGRRVIVFGKLLNGSIDGMVEFDEAPKPALIRQTLREFAAKFASTVTSESRISP